jgi:hypothetical protein
MMPNEAVDVGELPTEPLALAPKRTLARVNGMDLAEQRTLEIDGNGLSFRLRAPDGNVELSVRITADGPVLTFTAAAIEITKAQSFKVDVDRLELRSREMRIEAGCVETVVAGDSVTHCAGRHEVQADAVTLVSHGDTMVLDSTRDLAITGERVLINC